LKRLHKLRQDKKLNEVGINMVDLMMWLVIAALLLAAAIQGIGYYQKAAYIYQMKAAVEVAAGKITATAAIDGTSITKEIIDRVVAEENTATPNDQITITAGSIESYASSATGGESYGFERTSTATATTGGRSQYIKATHDAVDDREIAYFFQAAASYTAGVNVVDYGLLVSTEVAEQPPAGGGTVTPPDFTKDPVWTQQSGIGTNVWYGVTLSDDGQKMAVAPSMDPGVGNNGGRIRTSTDGGLNWTEQMGSPYADYRSIVSSSDGNFLLAGTYRGYMYKSVDSGVTWTEITAPGTGEWYTITFANDGKDIFAASHYGKPWISHDFGTTWTPVDSLGTGRWYGVAQAQGGKILVAAKYRGYTYTSTDHGVTWKENTAAGTNLWSSLAISEDGSNLVISNLNSDPNTGKLYSSPDLGATLIEETGAGSANWRQVAMSTDGTKILVGQIDTGSIVFSTDAGATWKVQTGAPKGFYYRLDITADGSKMIAGNSIPQTLVTGVVK
jgi:hypothetical protein